MSYILDALKKSEQERGRGDIPGVQTVHSSSLNYHGQKKAYWPYLLIVAVLLNLIAIVYFIVDKEQPTPIEVATPPLTATGSAKQATHDTAIAQATQTADTQTNVTTTTIDDSMKSDDEPIMTATSSPTQQAITTATADPEPASQTATTPAVAPPEKQVIEFYELPAAIKQQLPAIIISAHVYSSNPLQRSIVINNNFMEEGEYVIDELRLHEITPDGAIFDFRDTRFHHGVVSGWQ